jgi:hypothetical protein
VGGGVGCSASAEKVSAEGEGATASQETGSMMPDPHRVELNIRVNDNQKVPKLFLSSQNVRSLNISTKNDITTEKIIAIKNKNVI